MGSRLSLSLSLSFWFRILSSILAGQAGAATVDFSAAIDPPLVKKFSQYNAGLPPESNYLRDLDHLLPLRSDHLRMDLGMGKAGTTATHLVTGTAENPIYDFARIDRLALMLLERDNLPYWSWCYVPFPLQRRAGDWKSMRDDAAAFDAYRRFHREFAAHYAMAPGKPLRMGYHEIYNEPELPGMFLTETFDHYLRMYRAGATGIREGDPEAVVGGPAFALAEVSGHARRFASLVSAENLPLDFFSFHIYWVDENYPLELGAMRDALSVDARFRSVPIHVNELNWSGATAGENSVNNRHAIASRIFDVFAEVLKSHDVPHASWAQYMESTFGSDALGLVHRDGRKKAAYNAFKVYADMPEDRRAVTGLDSAFGAMASASPRKAVLAVWNRTDAARSATFDFARLPFMGGRLRVYRIDAQNASSGDGAYEDLRAVESRLLGEGAGAASWTGSIPGRGLAYIVLDDGSEEAFRDDRAKYPPARRPGRFLRSHHWYPDRAGTGYAYFDRKSWTARLGMGREPAGYSLTAAQADSLAPELGVRLVGTGEPRRTDARSALALRVDFLAGPGSASRSALLHWGLLPEAGAGALEALPWGNRRAADTVITASPAAEHLLKLSALAPPGWAGKAILSFLMRNTGAGSRAAIEIRRASGPVLEVDWAGRKGLPQELRALAGGSGIRFPGMEASGFERVELFDWKGRRIRAWSNVQGGVAPWSGTPPPAGLYRVRITGSGSSRPRTVHLSSP